MKNQTARFTCGSDSTLAVSVRRGHKDWLLTVRQNNPGQRTRVGCKEFVDLANEEEAQRSFDRLVKEALAAGWTVREPTERTPAFTVIPPPPVATTQPNAAPRMAGRR